MEYALVVSKSFVLGLKLHCKGCEAKVKRKLLSIQGVHTVSIDSKKGHITITGTVDPPTIISLLEKYSKKAVLLWEQTPSPKEASKSSINGENSSTDEERVQIIPKDSPITIDQFEDSKLAQTIEELSRGGKDLKEIEVTFSKTVKVVFNDNGEMKVVETTNSVSTGKDAKMVVNGNNSISTPRPTAIREEKTVMGTPYMGSGSCWCQVSGHMQHNHNYHGPPPPTPQSWCTTPSVAPYAPPLHQYYYQHDQNVFSDDNPSGCVVV